MPDLFGQEPSPRNSVDQEFDETFWPAFPRKVCKAAALKAFKSIRKEASLPAIMDMLATRKVEWAMNKRICFTPHASTFLRAESFVEPTTSSIPKPLHPSWNGMQAQLEKQLRDGEFCIWFGPETFEPGPPPTIICATQFRADYISSRFYFPLQRAFGEGVKIRAK